MINIFFSKYFGLGIGLAIALSFVFPFTAISLNPYAIFFLFALMYLSGLNIEWDKLKTIFRNPKELLLSNLLLFIVIPYVVLIFADFLLTDNLYVYGAVFSALTPAAVVAPFFTKIFKGDKELSFSILVSSMIISPIIIPLLLKFTVGEYLNIPSMLLFKDILVLVPLPLFLAFITCKFLKPLRNALSNSLSVLNFIFLALLIFVLFGVSINKLNLGITGYRNLSALFFLALLQDFGLLLFLVPIKKYLKGDEPKTIAIFSSISMKNIAIASGILLLYSPKAALAPAIGFIIHAFLYTPFFLFYLIKKSLKE